MILDPNFRAIIIRLLENNIRKGVYPFFTNSVVVMGDYIVESYIEAKRAGYEQEANIALAEILHDHVDIYVRGQFDYTSVPWMEIFQSRIIDVIGVKLFVEIINIATENHSGFSEKYQEERSRFNTWHKNFVTWCETKGREGEYSGKNNKISYDCEMEGEFISNGYPQHESLIMLLKN